MSRVLIYNALTQSKIDSLRRVFSDLALPGTGLVLEEVTHENFSRRMGDDVALLVLPGARAGSAYRDQLAGENLVCLKHHLSHGMNMLGICAGAYVMARQYEYYDYDSATGALLERRIISGSDLGLAEVRAYGPDLRLYPLKPREEENPWSVYTAAQVSFPAEGQQEQAALALSKGPSFTHVGENVSVFAKYNETGEAAIVQFRHGRGGGLLSGPALEVGGQNLMHYVHPQHREDPHCQSIITQLENGREVWAKLWTEVFVRLIPDRPDIHAQVRRNFGVREKPVF